MKIRYLWRIRALEYAIKCLGLWERYRVALGFDGPPLDIPIKRQVILGVPFRRRVRAAWCVLTGCRRKHRIMTIHTDGYVQFKGTVWERKHGLFRYYWRHRPDLPISNEMEHMFPAPRHEP